MKKMGIPATIKDSTTVADVWGTYTNGNPQHTFTFTLTSPTEAVMEMKSYNEDGTEKTNWHEYYKLRKIDYVPDWYTEMTSN